MVICRKTLGTCKNRLYNYIPVTSSCSINFFWHGTNKVCKMFTEHNKYFNYCIHAVTISMVQFSANRNLRCTHTCKQHVCTRNQMKNTQKSLCVLVITSISYVCSNFHWFVPYTPYIANRSRWKSFVVAEMNCNSLENFCSWIVVLCIIQGYYH